MLGDFFNNDLRFFAKEINEAFGTSISVDAVNKPVYSVHEGGNENEDDQINQ